MQVSLLNTELQRFVQEQVDSGRFTSATEVIEAAVTRLMLDEGPRLTGDEVAALRARVAQGLDAARQGDLSDGEEFFTALDREEESGGGQTRKTA